jgi:hypothetical protein
MTGIELRAWRDRAAVGDRITYHRGHLAHDRKIDVTDPNPQAVELGGLADIVWALYLRGRVRPMQRREGHPA